MRSAVGPVVIMLTVTEGTGEAAPERQGVAVSVSVEHTVWPTCVTRIDGGMTPGGKGKSGLETGGSDVASPWVKGAKEAPATVPSITARAKEAPGEL